MSWIFDMSNKHPFEFYSSTEQIPVLFNVPGRKDIWTVWKQRVKGAIFGHLEGNTCLFLFAGQSGCLLAQTESIDVNLVQISSLCFVRGSYLETNRARKVNLKSVLMDK